MATPSARLHAANKVGEKIVRWLAGESAVGLMHGSGALGEEFLLLCVEVKLYDLLDTILAEDTGHTDAEVLLAILAVEEGRARDETLLVVEH